MDSEPPDTPVVYRQRLASSSSIVSHHEDRLARHSQRIEVCEREIRGQEQTITLLRKEVVDLQLFVARTQGERAMLDVIKAVIPLLIGAAGLALSAWVAFHK